MDKEVEQREVVHNEILEDFEFETNEKKNELLERQLRDEDEQAEIDYNVNVVRVLYNNMKGYCAERNPDMLRNLELRDLFDYVDSKF